MEVQRKGRLWLASGRATACFWLRGRPMNGGLALASLVSAGEGIGCLGVVCVLARERAETWTYSPVFLFRGKRAACGLALSRQRGLFQEPKSQAKREGLWRLQQGKKRKAPFGLGENQETRERRPPLKKR